jgi:hypothetical protein
VTNLQLGDLPNMGLVRYYLTFMTIKTFILAIVSCLSVESSLFAISHSPGAFQSNRSAVAGPQVERAIKEFLFATYSGNAVEYQKWIIPEPGSDELINRRNRSPEELKELRAEADSIQLRQVSPFIADGNPLSSSSPEDLPIGTKTTYVTSFRGTLIVIPVVHTKTGWKIDVRFWVASKKQGEGSLKPSDPEIVAKQFLFYILAKQPEKLQQLSASRINSEEYTSANNLPGGDLDQILSLCLEMAIVRAREGECFRMPSGEIVRAGADKDTLVLVGLLGTSEVAFQVRRIGESWKAVPQRYFEMLRRSGAI